jgi:glycosyltransferase involved in cell wall biosynthesis
MAAGLDVPIHEIDLGGPRAWRYLRSVVRTVGLLASRRPAVVYAPNPSLVLTLMLIVLRPLFGYRHVSDSHYAGTVASSSLKQWVLRFCHRSADLVVVTNDDHAELIEKAGGRPFICEDPLPEIPGPEREPDPRSVLFICSYAEDEPFREVFAAAERLSERGFRIAASGNYRKRGIDPSEFPHVELLGFVPRSEYHARLRKAGVVIDLTEREACLVCGAYEAMSVECPAVLSSTRALRGYFTAGTVFTAHDPGSIAEAVVRAHDERARLAAEIKEWKLRAVPAMREKLARLRVAFGTQETG